MTIWPKKYVVKPHNALPNEFGNGERESIIIIRIIIITLIIQPHHALPNERGKREPETA